MSNKYIDIKVITWERYNLPNDFEFPEEINENNIEEILDNVFDCDYEFESLNELSDDMTVEENGGKSTIEIYENDYLIYENGNKTTN